MQRKRLEDAGFNPYAFINGGSSGNSSGGPSAVASGMSTDVGAIKPHFPNFGSNMIEFLEAQQRINNMISDKTGKDIINKNLPTTINTSNNLNDSIAVLNDQNTRNIRDLFPLQKQSLQSSINIQNAQFDLYSSEAAIATARALRADDLVQSDLDALSAKIRLMNTERLIALKKAPYEINNLIADTFSKRSLSKFYDNNAEHQSIVNKYTNDLIQYRLRGLELSNESQDLMNQRFSAENPYYIKFLPHNYRNAKWNSYINTGRNIIGGLHDIQQIFNDYQENKRRNNQDEREQSKEDREQAKFEDQNHSPKLSPQDIFTFLRVAAMFVK